MYKLFFLVFLAAVTVVFVFAQRSDWNENNYLIVADEHGNLSSKSEIYFRDKEDAVVDAVESKITDLGQNVRSQTAQMRRTADTRWDEITGMVDALTTRVSGLESRPSGGISENQQITLKVLPTESGQPMKFVVNKVPNSQRAI